MISKKFYICLIIIFTFSLIKTIKIKKKISLKKNEDEIAEKLSSEAIKIINSHLSIYNETSCLISSKLILTSICGIEKQEDLKKLNLTNNDNENLEEIRKLINNNYVVEIELMPDHHFIILRKNRKELYLLNSFQNIFSLKDWMNNNLIMKPYLTIDNFFSNFKTLINQFSEKKKRESAIINLFLPNIFSKDKKKIKNIKKWFDDFPIFISSVKYASYNFKDNKNLTEFKKIFENADIKYYL